MIRTTSNTEMVQRQRALLGGKVAVPAVVTKAVAGLPAMIKAAADKLSKATTAAEVLDARDTATLAYDASKRAARVARAKGAHDKVVAAAHRSQADALEIEAAAKRILADEYDAVQPEAAKKGGRPKTVPAENGFTAKEVGLGRKEIHDAREHRDAEVAQPGVVKAALEAAIADKREPSRTVVRAAVSSALGKVKTTKPTDHVAVLLKAWGAADDGSRRRFLDAIGAQRIEVAA